MGKKQTQYQKMAVADSIASILSDIGYEPVEINDCMVLATGKTLNLYVDFRSDEIFFGIRGEFDRWANSRDYVFEGIYFTPEELECVVRLAETKCAEGLRRDDDFEPVMLNRYWRKFRNAYKKDLDSTPEPD